MREAVQRLTTIRFKLGDHVRDRDSGIRDGRLRAERPRASRLSHRPLQRQPQRLARRRPRRAEGPLCGRSGRVMLGKFDAADGLVVPDVDTAR
jgi:hypothetical protein